jgi:Cft2 family RNA processing exonuclease
MLCVLLRLRLRGLLLLLLQGSVLLPVDSAGRMLELLLTLEKMWATTEPK